MYYAGKGLAQAEVTAVDPDPYRPFVVTPPGLEYRIAWPVGYPWWWSPNPNLGPEAFYMPVQTPYPPEARWGNLLPRWTGSFIQPREMDPVAFELDKGGPKQAFMDPTGGEFAGGGDPIYGDVLGPGASLAVGMQWAGDPHPRGFSAMGWLR